MTAEFSMSNNQIMIDRLVIVLGRKFCLSSTPNTRKGGLLGLAAVMVGFKNGTLSDPQPELVDKVVRPILTCFLDSDSRVRYYACESLYNVTKVAKANILPLFNDIFDNMTKIVADPDIGVRSGAEVLDRLLKDIIVEQQSFDAQSFVPKLEEYTHTKNLFTRMFIISWIRLLDSKIEMIQYLPKLLDGIFTCLYDSTEEIRASTLNLLSEFLNKLVQSPSDKVNIPSLIGTILKHTRNNREEVVQYTAIAWLRQLVTLLDDNDLITHTPDILAAILPCLELHSTPEGSVISQNQSSQRHNLLQSTGRGNVVEISNIVNSALLEQVIVVLGNRRNTPGPDSIPNDLEPILEVLVKELQKQEHPMVKLAILDWLRKLKRAEPELLMANTLQHKLFQILLETLSAPSDAVVKKALHVIADIFCFDYADEQPSMSGDLDDNAMTKDNEDDITELEKKKSPAKIQSGTKSPRGSSKKVAIATGDSPSTQQSTANIARFIQALCKTFRDKETVFEDRGTFIILNLCSMLKPHIIYCSFAEILKDEKVDLKFAYKLVQKLNKILLTTQPLYSLRSRLSNDDDPEMVATFHTLYYAWCHSPIDALTLCFLTNNYRHASEIVMALAQTDINVDMLTQIDWVVHLIESPIFASLRMRLLDVTSNQYLLQSLYSLLMILPQSEAYKKLSHRLNQAHKFMSVQPTFRNLNISGTASSGTTTPKPGTSIKESSKKTTSVTGIESLMKHYFHIQNQRSKLSYTSENED